MTALRSFATAFCCVCVISGGLYLLCPTGKIEKTVRYVFGLIFVLCLLSIVPGFKQTHIALPSSTTVSTPFNTFTVENIRQTFATTLENAGITYQKIEVCTDNLPNGGITITKVTVITAADAATVRELLGGEQAEYAIEIIAG